MIINGKSYPSIGFIRAKPVAERPGRWLLSIWPPADSMYLDTEDEGLRPSFVEVVVDGASVERIARVAPHLIPGVAYHHKPALLGLSLPPSQKLGSARAENRPGPSPSMQTVISEQS